VTFGLPERPNVTTPSRIEGVCDVKVVKAGCAALPDPRRGPVVVTGTGTLWVTLDGTVADLGAGDVIRVPANAGVKIDGGPGGGTARVPTTPGLDFSGAFYCYW
jgi:hypothetical protein